MIEKNPTMRIAFLFLMITLILCQPILGYQSDPSATKETPENPVPPKDIRLGPLRSLNSEFLFVPPRTRSEWETRKEKLRKHMLISLGLWPMPTRTPLNPVMHGLMEFDDYTIEKVYFESMPGFLVTGNLYRPKNLTGKAPGVLCPHGHHRDGRFRRASDAEIDQQIGNGSEQFRPNARSPLQARCVHLARLGCVVFHYDMIGYADNQQISYDLAHRFETQRPDMISADGWGLFSPRAEANLQSVMGLQTWNSIRSLDFLESLPEVDGDRIGVTGASGGGTQTFILCALDDRPVVSFPAVMVSTAMQGGCTCENCCYLRIGTGNVEFAAMFAPKPQGLTAANDWTIEMETKGFPELQQLYSLYGKPDNVHLTSRIEFNHNYNQVSREAMYRWFSMHLGLTRPTTESRIQFLDSHKLTVFSHPDHKKPATGKHFEKNLLKWWRDDIQTQLEKLIPTDEESLAKYRAMLSPVLATMVGRTPSEQTTFSENLSSEEKKLDDKTTEYTIVVKNKIGELVKGVVRTRDDARDLVVLATEEGSAVFESKHPQNGLVKRLLESQFSVLAIDHMFIEGTNRLVTGRVKNNREAAAYTLGYNSPQLIKRVHSFVNDVNQKTTDELEIFVDEAKRGVDPDYFVVALDRSAIDISVALAQTALLDGAHAIKGVVLDTRGFRFANVESIRDPYFLPGGARYFDLPGFLALAAPTPMLVYGETEESASILRQAYSAANKQNRLKLIKHSANESHYGQIINWLIRHSQR